MSIVHFHVSHGEHALIQSIADRAMTLARQAGDRRIRPIDFMMDVTAVHANGCPLRLSELAAAPDFDFVHDVFGIHQHLDRSTGKLMDCFVPRFAQAGGL